jgi:hypothetical protein
MDRVRAWPVLLIVLLLHLGLIWFLQWHFRTAANRLSSGQVSRLDLVRPIEPTSVPVVNSKIQTKVLVPERTQIRRPDQERPKAAVQYQVESSPVADERANTPVVEVPSVGATSAAPQIAEPTDKQIVISRAAIRAGVSDMEQTEQLPANRTASNQSRAEKLNNAMAQTANDSCIGNNKTDPSQPEKPKRSDGNLVKLALAAARAVVGACAP